MKKIFFKKIIGSMAMITALVIVSSLLFYGVAKADESDPASNGNLPVIDMGSLQAGVTVVNIDNVQTITSTLEQTIINATSSNIAAGSTVKFVGPTYDNGAMASFLFRDIGNSPSNIDGNILSNSFLVWVNQNGINIGADAHIDAPSLVLSTRDITDSNFLSANYIFEKQLDQETDRLLLNKGTITISQGGFGVLIAGAVENQGVIVCPLGTIVLAGGSHVQLGISSNKFLSIVIDDEQANDVYDYAGNKVKDQLKNSGSLIANGGMVILRAEALPGIFEKAINMSGYIKANKIDDKDGVVKLISSGAIEISGEISATRIEIGKEATPPASVNMTDSAKLIAEESIRVAADRVSVNTASPVVEINKTKGDLYISNSQRIGDLITIEGTGLKVTYLANSDFTLKTDGTADTSPAVILYGNSITVIARHFGNSVTPLNIDSPNIHIRRTVGDIEIAQSVGIGTSIQITGPPDSGFGQIIYPKSSSLSLEAARVVILGGTDPLHFYGNITFSSLYCTTPGTTIYFEAAHTYTITGVFHFTGSLVNNSTASYIHLKSSEAGLRWFIDPQGAHELAYVRAEDSYNLDPRLIRGTSLDHNANSYNWDAPRYWLGTTSVYWNEPFNWAATDGGAGGAGVPTSEDDVYFTSTRDTPCSIDVTISCLSFTIESMHYSVVINTSTLSQTIATLSIPFTGTLSMEGCNLYVTTLTNYGTILNPGPGSSFTDSSGLVQFTSFNPTIPPASYYNLQLDNGGIWTSGASIANTLYNYNYGTLDMQGYDLSVINLTNNSTILNPGSASSFTDSYGWVQFTSLNPTIPSVSYYNLQLDNGGSWTSGASIAGTLYNYNSGILDMQGYDLSVINLTNNGTILNAGPSSYISSSASPMGTFEYTVTCTIPSVGINYSILKLNGEGQIFTLGAGIALENINLAAGTLDSGGYDIYLSGNWTTSGTGAFISTNQVSFNGTVNQYIYGASSFFNLWIDNTTSSVIMDADVNVGSNFVINSGTFYKAGHTLTVTGSSIYDYSLDSPAQVDDALFTDYLIIDRAGTYSLNSNISDVININLSDGALSANGYDIAISGNWTCSGTASFSPGVRTVTFNGASSQSIQSNGVSFNNLIHSGTGTLQNTDALAVLSDLTNSSGTLTLGNVVNIGGKLYINAGTLTGTGNITVSGGEVSGSGTINLSAGTFLLDGDGYFGGSADWSFFNLTFGNGIGEETTYKNGANNITILNDLTISLNQRLEAGSHTWSLAWGMGEKYLTDISEIAAGYSHTVALKSDGTRVYAWGLNGNGQLGDGTTTQRTTPVLVKGVGGTGYLGDTTNGGPISKIAAGSSHTVALKSDGTRVYAWGYNGNGQLGDGTTTQRTTPVLVKGINGTGYLGDTTNGGPISEIAAGYSHTVALKSDGTRVYSWGYNDYGQLGDGTMTQSTTPVMAKILTFYYTSQPFIVNGIFIPQTSTFEYCYSLLYVSTGDVAVTNTTYYDLKINNSYATAHILYDNAIVTHDFTVSAGTFDQASYTLNVAGDFTIASGATFTKASGGQALTLNGTGDLTDNSVVKQDLGNVVIGGTAVTRTLTTAVTMTGLTIDSGDILSANGKTITAATFENNGTLQLLGTENLTGMAKDSSSGKIEYVGTLDALNYGYDYYDVTFNNALGTWTLANALTANGDLEIAAGGTLNANGKGITVAGDWTNSGTFTNGGNTVTFNGTAQSITGNNTFYNITKTGAGSLTFAGNSTTTIEGLATFNGAGLSGLLTLNKDGTGSYWNINITSNNYNFSYLNVFNSDNKGLLIYAPNSTINSSIGWMGITRPPSPAYVSNATEETNVLIDDFLEKAYEIEDYMIGDEEVSYEGGEGYFRMYFWEELRLYFQEMGLMNPSGGLRITMQGNRIFIGQ